MPGRVFLVWEPHGSFPRDPAHLRESGCRPRKMLARVHMIDWQQALPDWEQPRPLAEEIERWTKILRHARGSGLVCGRHRARNAARVTNAGRSAGRPRPWRLPARQHSLRQRPRRRPDRLGVGLDRCARPRPWLDVDDDPTQGLAPSLAAGRSGIGEDLIDALSRGRRSGAPTHRMVSGPGAAIVSARSPASTSNFIAPASVRMPCGNASRHLFRSCSRAASSLPNARAGHDPEGNRR